MFKYKDYPQVIRQPNRLFRRLAALAFCVGGASAIAIMLSNPLALLGYFLCFGVCYLLLRIILYSIYEPCIKQDCIRIFLFAYVFIGLLSLLPMFANFHKFGNYYSGRGDEVYFFSNALQFAETGKITYSLFDLLGGCLAFFYQAMGHEADVMCLVPINWGSAALLVVVSYLLVHKVTGSVSSGALFLLAALCNFCILDISTYYMRDIIGALFLLLGIYYFAHGRVYQGFCNSVLAFFVRGGNGLMAFAAYPFLRYAHIWQHRKGVVILLTVCTLMLGYYAAESAADYAGSVFNGLQGKGRSAYGFFENRATLMEKGIDRATDLDKFDTTIFFYQLGPIGLPFRYVTNIFAPVRASKLFDYRAKQDWGGAIVYGFWPDAIYGYIYILSLPFIAPYLLYGFYSAYEDNRYLAWLFYFVTVLSAIVIFSQQERHKLMFIVLYPLFVEIGLKRTIVKKTEKKVMMLKYILMLFLYLPNFYFLLR